MLVVTPQIVLDDTELHETFVRASGPGGQNVNKVATTVHLRFDVAASPSLPADVRARLLQMAGQQITTDGVLVIKAGRFRTQEHNRQDARDRLVALIRMAVKAPTPRHATKPTHAARQRRMTTKRRQGVTKKLRQAPRGDDGG